MSQGIETHEDDAQGQDSFNKIQLVKDALALAKSRGFVHVEVEDEGLEFSAVLTTSKVTKKSAAEIAHQGDSDEPKLVIVKSPVVGYYRDQDEPLKIGASIKKGDLIATIAVLGLANDVECSVDGIIEEFFVKDGDPVEFGKPILSVKVEK